MPIKERHWNSLVTSLRHGQCVLLLGSELPCLAPARSAVPGPDQGVWTTSSALADHLRSELEQDGKITTGSTLPVAAQNYEDAEGFGHNALRSAAAKFLSSSADRPSSVHQAIASLPFRLIVTTGQDATFRNALVDQGKAPISVRYHFRGDRRDNPEFAQTASAQAPILYHLFGDC